VIVIKLFAKDRTRPQDRLYFKWVGIAAKDFGYSVDDLHDELKDQFLPKVEYVIFGKKKYKSTSLTKLSVVEMISYMDKVYHLLTVDFNIRLPLPVDLHTMQD